MNQGTVFTLIVVRIALGISSNGSTSSQSQRARTISNSSLAPSHEDAKCNYSKKLADFPASVSEAKGFDLETGYSNAHAL